MAKLCFKWLRLRACYLLLIPLATLLAILIHVNSSWSLFRDAQHTQAGIVPVEGLGRAGVKYPTKPPGHVYPTIKAGQLRNQQLGFVLKDDEDEPIKVRGNWFEEEMSPKKQNKTTTTLRPMMEQRANLNDGPVGTPMPRLDGVNIISMTLYGSGLRYTMGAIRNAELARVNFPGWTLRVYTETPSEKPYFGLVPETVLSRLRALGVDIHFIDPADDFVPPMMWRFLVADDPAVDRFIIRDADARLLERDAAAVAAWVASGRAFQCIRDHPSHAAYALSGGLWGARPRAVRDLLRGQAWRDMMRGVRKEYLEDMNFLNHVIWPRVWRHAYCSDSVSCDQFPNAFPFPVRRFGYEHVGGVYNEHDLARPIDIDIIRQAGENPHCLPGTNATHALGLNSTTL